MFHRLQRFNRGRKTARPSISTGSRNGSANLKMKPKNAGVANFLLLGDGLDHEVRAVADVSRRAEKHRADADGEDLQGCCAEQFMDVAGAGHAEKRAQETEIRRRIVERAGQHARAPEKNAGRGMLRRATARRFDSASPSAGIIVAKIPANKMATSRIG